tara:strand:+ start:219 stop:449 length:231 start_codon:yes stop_codon:yes gene_type:complete
MTTLSRFPRRLPPKLREAAACDGIHSHADIQEWLLGQLNVYGMQYVADRFGVTKSAVGNWALRLKIETRWVASGRL